MVLYQPVVKQNDDQLLVFITDTISVELPHTLFCCNEYNSTTPFSVYIHMFNPYLHELHQMYGSVCRFRHTSMFSSAVCGGQYTLVYVYIMAYVTVSVYSVVWVNILVCDIQVDYESRIRDA